MHVKVTVGFICKEVRGGTGFKLGASLILELQFQRPLCVCPLVVVDSTYVSIMIAIIKMQGCLSEEHLVHSAPPKLPTGLLLFQQFEEERRCNTRGGKPSESLSEENCPLEALGFFSSLECPTAKPSRGPLRGSGIFFGVWNGRSSLSLHLCFP